jgi:hypothetical protein
MVMVATRLLLSYLTRLMETPGGSAFNWNRSLE